MSGRPGREGAHRAGTSEIDFNSFEGESAPEYAIGRCETLTDTSLAELRTNLRTIKELDGVAILCALIAT
jgi:hypothetical protein